MCCGVGRAEGATAQRGALKEMQGQARSRMCHELAPLMSPESQPSARAWLGMLFGLLMLFHMWKVHSKFYVIFRSMIAYQGNVWTSFIVLLNVWKQSE